MIGDVEHAPIQTWGYDSIGQSQTHRSRSSDRIHVGVEVVLHDHLRLDELAVLLVVETDHVAVHVVVVLAEDRRRAPRAWGTPLNVYPMCG